MPEYKEEVQKTEAELAAEATAWNPSDEQKARVKYVYDERADMTRARDLTYVQFNDRTLKQFIDDSEKRLNAYVLSKAAQGKEDWQANFATRAYANKTKALLAATARDLPDMRFTAVNQSDQYHHFAADMMKNLVRHSYNQGNPQEEMFFLAWSNCGHGTVLSYEGFEKQMYTKQRITAFDMATGDVEVAAEEVVSVGEPVSYEIQLMKMLIKNFYIRDVQQQPSIILEDYFADKERFEAIYGKFPNFAKVRDCGDIKPEENDTYFHSAWKEACESGKGFYVARYMNKWKGGMGCYRIVANGVELFNGPMLWIDVTQKNFGRPAYPVAKTIYEPFANTDFFYGNSQPNSAMGEGDVLNTLYNSSLDKQYRSLVPPLLVGMVNKDMLDLEDEVVSGDTKIYVDDINQVKQMEMKGITSSDVQMINLISQGLDLTTLDPQSSGASQRYVTARAAVAADENAKKLKGVFFMFMESLWLQKTRLRVGSILMSYTKPKLKIILGDADEQKFEELMRTFNVKGAKLSDGTKGTLSIGLATEGQMGDRKALKADVEAEEARNYLAGHPYERVIIPYSYLERYAYDVEIVPETLWQSSQAINMAMVVEKINLVKSAFPEYFAKNKEVFFTDLIKNYNDDINRYELPPTMDFAQEQGLELAKGAAGRGGKEGGAGRVSADAAGPGGGSGPGLAEVMGQ